MQREASPPRTDWQQKLESIGMTYHHLDGKPYWTEDARYRLRVSEVEALEAATEELHRICLEAVDHVVKNQLWDRLAIPRPFADYVTASWKRGDPSMVGRFDLSFDGWNPPKLLEYNADTPTALLEMAVAQWFWMKDVVIGADQFNSAHERLIDAWKDLAKRMPPGNVLYFARSEDDPEDFATSEYLRDTCVQGGLPTKTLRVTDIGWNGKVFTDLEEKPIRFIHKLYPWEWMLREAFGQHILTDQTGFLEPPWKMILSNKGILPILWQLFPDHPNLLPTFFDEFAPQLGLQYVRKPLYSREGANVSLIGPGLGQKTEGAYGQEGYIYQAYSKLPVNDGQHAVVGSWVIAGQPAGIGIREDPTPITHNFSRFVPHYF
ncbi:MAG TPA: glutathionylspermidine synthase family protein [Vineibacter sp.]|nr:glutathionylspermidine synthase family protein [Vineibacter sp.]